MQKHHVTACAIREGRSLHVAHVYTDKGDDAKTGQ